MKIIPAIDLMEGKVVRLYKGDPNKKTIYSDNPLEIAKKWESAGADMIHLVDLDATLGTYIPYFNHGNKKDYLCSSNAFRHGLRSHSLVIRP